jgi:DNA polymerase-4
MDCTSLRRAGQAFVESLPIAKFYGVGAATAQKMQALGIHTGFDLKQWSEADLRQHFGKAGSYYYRVARAEDERPVNPNRSRKSIGAEQSFAEDLAALDAMDEALATLAEEVATRMDKRQRYGHTLALKVKYADYQQITRSQTVIELLRDAATLYSLARDLLRSHLDPTRKVRLLGLTVSNLTEPLSKPLYNQLQLELPPFF